MTRERYLRNLEAPTGLIDAVLDTDAYNEIDDQFAIAFLLRCGERARVRALYAAPFLNQRSVSPGDGMEKSYQEILRVLSLAGRDDLREHVYRGSEAYLPDERTPVPSDAATHLAALARGYSPENPLYVVAIGAITNVASALLACPDIAQNLVIVWLGGNAHHSPDTREFNMMQDVAAARVVFGSDAPLVQVPCVDVASAFRVSGPELEHWLAGRNALCDYLASNTIREAESYARGRVWSRPVWDVTAVAWLVNDGDRFLLSRLVPAPVPEYDHRYAPDPSGRLIRYIYRVQRDELFGELFERLAR